MHSRGNYSSQFVRVCVCVSVCSMLTVPPFIYGPKIRYHRLLYDDFLDFDSRISLKRLCSRDMAFMICLPQRVLTLSATRRHTNTRYMYDRLER